MKANEADNPEQINEDDDTVFAETEDADVCAGCGWDLEDGTCQNEECVESPYFEESEDTDDPFTGDNGE